jgi:hypothetical protein
MSRASVLDADQRKRYATLDAIDLLEFFPRFAC